MWSIPLIFIIMLTPFLSWLDLQIAGFFYSIGNDPVEHFVSNHWVDFLFKYGTFPANFTAGLASLTLVFSYFFSSFKKWRPTALTLILTLALGSGFLINGTLKEYWGRPRPKQVTQFGGTQAFRPFYSPNFFHQPMPSKSFPSGHASMGFFFFALAIAGKRLNNKYLRRSGLALALLLGLALSLSRMAQGGHFFSDVLFSGIIMWYVALSMDWLVYAGEHTYENFDPQPKRSL